MRAFRCQHSGKYFPGDYAKEWGRTTGIGLGPRVVSECLDTAYHLPPVRDEDGRAIYPVGITHAGVDLVEVTEEEFEANRLILHKEDPQYERRMAIMLDNQKAKLLAQAQSRAAAISERGPR